VIIPAGGGWSPEVVTTSPSPEYVPGLLAIAWARSAVWGKVAGCLAKEKTVFDRAQPMNRRITDRIDTAIDQDSVVTEDEKAMLFGRGMP